MSQEVQIRYLTAADNSHEELIENLLLLLDDLGVNDLTKESVRLNPTTDHWELEATVNSSFEYYLVIWWKPGIIAPILITFDIKLFTPIEPYHLDEVMAEPTSQYFPKPILVYNSYGRQRTINLFPLLIDFENVVRELIVTIMLERFGSCWWDRIMIREGLKDKKQKSEESQIQEVNERLHDYMAMHALYYLDLKDLREIMEQADEEIEPEVRKNLPNFEVMSLLKRRKWERELLSQLPFAGILDNYDQVSISSKISELRELRNRVMHGRYLTESNERTIISVCELYDRYLIKAGHVGDFDLRTLQKHRKVT